MDPLKRLRVESRREPKGWPLKLLEQSQRRKLPARSTRKILAPKNGGGGRMMPGMGKYPTAIFLVCVVITSAWLFYCKKTPRHKRLIRNSLQFLQRGMNTVVESMAAGRQAGHWCHYWELTNLSASRRQRCGQRRLIGNGTGFWNFKSHFQGHRSSNKAITP